jgi:GNAT superfamily N-acetyltransferase
LQVVRATKEDLRTILGWLEREYVEDGSETGFWNNRNIITNALTYEELWVIRDRGEAVAYQVGDYAADIANVRKDRQRQGYGTALFEAALARAYADNVNVMKGECMPRTSLPFWQKLGFERYGDMSEWGQITVRRLLPRQHILPPDLPPADVLIEFLPEAALHREDVEAVASHRPRAGRRSDGTILLDQRIMALKDSEPDHRDLAIRITADDAILCCTKAKYPEAKALGVEDDRRGETYYIDAILPLPAA